MWRADARTYYSRLQVNHGVEFNEAKQYRDDFIQGKRDAGQFVSDKSGFYISSTIKNQGQTGLSHCCAAGILTVCMTCDHSVFGMICSSKIKLATTACLSYFHVYL